MAQTGLSGPAGYTTGERPPSTLIDAAGHIGGGVGGEEGGDAGELLGPAHAAQRHRAAGLRDEVLERDVGALALRGGARSGR